MEWKDAVAMEGLPEGRPVGVRVGMKAIVLVRRGQKVAAMDALCTHKFGPLEDGEVIDGHIACPLHDARFDLETGTPAPGGVTGVPLRVHPARVVAGRVQVHV